MSIQRREFVQRLPAAGAGMVLGVSGLSLAGCGRVEYLVPATAPGRLSVRVAELGADAGTFVQGPGMSRPIFLRRDDQGEVVALLASCTHNGCQTSPVAGRLVCPCHGSEFSFGGEVLQGPAARPLTRYEVSEEEGQITVWLDRQVSR